MYSFRNFLFVGGRRSMMRITSDPLKGWAIEEVKKADNGGAQNDVYGKLFYHARDQFRLFIKRLRTLTVNIEVHCKDVQALPTAFPGVKFDRIIVSSLCCNRLLCNLRVY
ncbi:hypothetical protein F4860DRAFT_477782 [Xylaria cubensis]|nr:hypothetical protein F4860DRAFT_477782 [Xylaria cubensis]